MESLALRDDAATGAYRGPERGVGAVYTFAGRKSGSGNISITDVQSPQRVDMRLVMTKPMACDNKVQFVLTPSGSATKVSWSMEGRAPLFAKMMQTVFDMDRMVGRDFESGLTALKAKIETPAQL